MSSPALRDGAVDGRVMAWSFMAIAAVIFALDVVTFVRLLAFESAPPAVHQTEAAVREIAPPRGRRGSWEFQVETKEGWMSLGSGPATVFGTPRTGVGSKRVLPNVWAKVTWIDAPVSAFRAPVHYPIHVEQAGRVLIHVDGAAGIAKTARTDLLTEAGIVLAVMAFLAGCIVVANRRRAARLAEIGAAWRQRQARRTAEPLRRQRQPVAARVKGTRQRIATRS